MIPYLLIALIVTALTMAALAREDLEDNWVVAIACGMLAVFAGAFWPITVIVVAAGFVYRLFQKFTH